MSSTEVQSHKKPSLSPTDSNGLHVNDNKIVKSFAEPNWYIQNFAANIRIRAETVATLLEGVALDRIIDVGCGDGSLSIPLVLRVKHVTYLDQSAAMLNLVASRIGQPNSVEVLYINKGFMEAELPEAGYDLVICAGVLAYVQDVGSFLKKIRSIMRPGGMLILECTDAYHFVSRMVRLYRGITGLLKPKRFVTYRHRASEVVAATEAQGLHLNRTFCYLYNLPILEKLLSNQTTYKWVRRIFGDVMNNRRAWLGKEYIFYFTSK